jgi:histidinol dehydrogenase
MKILKSGTREFRDSIQELLDRRGSAIDKFSSEVDAAISVYRQKKEWALCEWSKTYDQVTLEPEELWVSEDAIKNSHKLVSAEIRKALDHTKERVERFQEELKLSSFQSSSEAGVFWGGEIRPLDRVGIYVPGGRANYFLTLLLCAIPARIAGVKELIVATPPKRKLAKPYVDPALLYLAKLLSISKILVSGGVGGLAALAFGTQKSLPVDKVVGSGGLRTSVAKLRLSGYVGTDGISGPSETAFLCDETTDVKRVAADIIGRADHDPEAEILVFHADLKWIESLVQHLAQAVEALRGQSDRESIQECLERRTIFFQTKDLEEAIEYSNQIAPGVVCLSVDEASGLVSKVNACGSLLIGHFTPPVGLDLVGGASGLVGTWGSANYSLSMSPASFVRRFTVMEFDSAALGRFQKEAICLAEEEGFLTHEASFKTRLEEAP